MNTFIYLSTCNTCMRILKGLDLPEETKLQDVKQQSLSTAQLEALYLVTQSYEQLINKRSRVINPLSKLEKHWVKRIFNNYYKQNIVVSKDLFFIGITPFIWVMPKRL